jgi:Carbamoyl-phosphate synthase L chain, ATP binding domain
MKPNVLLATTSPPRWFAPARLAVALVNAGWTVDCISVAGHTLGKTTAVRKTYTYDGLAPLISYADAIAAAMPDLIIPCDDVATLNLHNLYWKEQRRGSSGTRICALIERSLGSPEYFPVAFARSAFAEIARKEGIRVPKTGVIANTDDLNRWASDVGFPCVLKADCTSGGEGVRIVQSLDEAQQALRVLQAPPLLMRAAKRAIIDQDTSLVWPSLLRTRSVVNAQEFISGREATSLVACWQGTVLASLHFEVLNKRESAGPATVIRWIDDPDMKSAAEKLARRLNLSGLHGFDFMLEDQTGNAYLIELNPRATQVGHLALGPGRDLPAAMYAAVTGEAVHEARKVTANNTIVLFPHEWIRNPKSPYLQTGYHDVPFEEPELLRASLRTREKQNAWSSEQKWNQELSADQVRRP